MTDQEIIYKAIREVVNTNEPAEFAANNSTCYTIAKYVCEELREKLNSLPAEQPSEDVEENIEEKINEYWNEWFSHGEYFEGILSRNVFAAYCHKIANWQKEQMMKNAIPAKVVNDETSGCVVDCEQGCLVLEPHTYPIGRKLKILIMEDEQCSTE